MTANRQRGEVPFMLSARTLVLRPSFSALCEAEERTGCGIMALAAKLNEGEMSLREMTYIIHACLRAVPGQEAPAPDEIGAALVNGCLGEALKALVALFCVVLGSEGYE